MKTDVILLGVAVLFTAGCSTTLPEKTGICRKATVAQVPAGNVDAFKTKSFELDAFGAILRGGLYLREIEGETYLFQYLEKQQAADASGFQGLEELVEPLPEAARTGLVFEPMERVFYEAGAADKTPEAEVKRIAMFTELKPEKEAHYRLLHDNPWPDVIAAIKKANFRHFSIFLEEINGKVYLFGWLEYVGEDIVADGVENRKDPASIRWWEETDACLIAPEGAGDGMWGGMNEIFFTQ